MYPGSLTQNDPHFFPVRNYMGLNNKKPIFQEPHLVQGLFLSWAFFNKKLILEWYANYFSLTILKRFQTGCNFI